MSRAYLSPLQMLCFLLFLVLITCQQLPQGCQYSNYTSKHTRCELSFISCFTYRKLKECIMKKCERYIRGSQCRLQTTYVLQQQDCYKSCCGSVEFNENVCNLYNDHKLKQQEKADIGLTIVLILISIGLVVIVVCFVVKYLKCLKKNDSFLIIKFNVKWKQDKYQDSKCQICRTYGAVMLTPCNHYFHVSCFEQHCKKQMSCPKCNEKIRKRMKFYCNMCRNQSFKVGIKRVCQIADALKQGKALHSSSCNRQIKTQTTLI